MSTSPKATRTASPPTRAVADPDSALYGKYLSAEQAQARFGASNAQIAAVRTWLTPAGLKVTDVTRHYVSVTGEVAAVEKAFGTQLHDYAKGPGLTTPRPPPPRCRRP